MPVWFVPFSPKTENEGEDIAARPIVFRTIGFAVATVLIRLALTAPRFIDAGLGITAAVFVVALTWIFNLSAMAYAEHEEQPCP